MRWSAGAFNVLVSACVMATGLDELILATLISGLIMITAGVLWLGTYIRYIPCPVTMGFTAGIAVIVLARQLREMFGLALPGGSAERDPAEAGGAVGRTWDGDMGGGLGCWIGGGGDPGALGVPRHWPGMLIAVALASVVVGAPALPVATIGTRIGDLPRMLPVPSLPDFRLPAVQGAFPWALSFALPGAIESLLSAVAADGMSGARHRLNAELVAQGVAKLGSALFGGVCGTGTIARTATNVRAGKSGPVSGMLHLLFLLVFLLVAAPFAACIPLAALAGVLAVAAWGMAERQEFASLLRSSRGDALVVIWWA